MTKLSRRAFGRLALAAPALTTGLSATLASMANAAGHGAVQTPSLVSAQIGTYRVTAMLDGMASLSREFFFGPDAAAIDAAIAEAGVGPDVIRAPFTAYVVQSEDRTILVDAGMGDVDILGPGFGQVAAGLNAMGLAAADIDTVVLTHAHPDHLGGLISGGAATFPNAELVMMEVEFQYWSDDGMMAQAPEGMQGLFPLARMVLAPYSGRTTLVADGFEVAPGVTLRLSPGHTPGHALVHIDGGDQSLLMLSDSMHSADLHTAMPEVGFGFDVDAALAATSRARLLDELATDKTLVAGSHIHFPGFGRILRSGDAYRFAAASI